MNIISLLLLEKKEKIGEFNRFWDLICDEIVSWFPFIRVLGKEKMHECQICRIF